VRVVFRKEDGKYTLRKEYPSNKKKGKKRSNITS
jgi:hypothetical protein